MAKLLKLITLVQATDSVDSEAAGNLDAVTSKTKDLAITYNAHVNTDLPNGTALLPFYPAGVAASTRLQFIGRVIYNDTEPFATRQITLTVDTNTIVQGEVVSFITVGAAEITSVQNTALAKIIGEWFIIDIT